MFLCSPPALGMSFPNAPDDRSFKGVRTLTIAERRQQQLKQQQAQGPTASTPSQPAQPVSSATKSPPSVAESTRTTKAGETNSLLDDIASSFADHVRFCRGFGPSFLLMRTDQAVVY
eukprot:m.475179 g.475179  ORF g.475179 m.475179 type:complete len:117 (-) comp57140_c0_seq33:221-571(-)